MPCSSIACDALFIHLRIWLASKRSNYKCAAKRPTSACLLAHHRMLPYWQTGIKGQGGAQSLLPTPGACRLGIQRAPDTSLLHVYIPRTTPKPAPLPPAAIGPPLAQRMPLPQQSLQLTCFYRRRGGKGEWVPWQANRQLCWLSIAAPPSLPSPSFSNINPAEGTVPRLSRVKAQLLLPSNRRASLTFLSSPSSMSVARLRSCASSTMMTLHPQARRRHIHERDAALVNQSSSQLPNCPCV